MTGQVPEVRCRSPFQSQTGQIDSSIHQQEKDGHPTGDGVQFTGEQHLLVETRGTAFMTHIYGWRWSNKSSTGQARP